MDTTDLFATTEIEDDDELILNDSLLYVGLVIALAILGWGLCFGVKWYLDNNSIECCCARRREEEAETAGIHGAVASGSDVGAGSTTITDLEMQ